MAALPAAQDLPRAWTRRVLASPGLKPYLLLFPSLLFLALFTYYPIVEVAWGSLFRSVYGQKAPVFVGLGNYVRVLEDGAFRNALLNNVIYGVGTIVPSLVIALGLALALDGSSRFKAVVRSLIFLPTLKIGRALCRERV